MSVLLRVLAVVAFSLLLLRGAFACESVQPGAAAPVAAHCVDRSTATGDHRHASCDGGCCVGCGAHCGLLPATLSLDLSDVHGDAPAAFADPHRAGIVRAPLLPPPIV